MSPEELEEKLGDLQWRLRKWEMEIWIRHAESPTPVARSLDCVICKGIGRAHWCLVPDCGSEDLSECLHPNEFELTAFHKIRAEAGRLLGPVLRGMTLQEVRQDPKKLLSRLLATADKR